MSWSAFHFTTLLNEVDLNRNVMTKRQAEIHPTVFWVFSPYGAGRAIPSVFNLGKALALALICMSWAADYYTTTLLLTHSSALEMIITQNCNSGPFLMLGHLFDMQFNSFFYFLRQVGHPRVFWRSQSFLWKCHIVMRCRHWKEFKTLLFHPSCLVLISVMALWRRTKVTICTWSFWHIDWL